MGQEILYCNTCGKRLVGDDFTRGRAHTFNNRQYCSACLPQNISSGAQAAEPAQASTTPKLKALKASSSRAIPAVPPAKSSGPNALVLVGVAFAVSVIVIVFVVSSSKPDPLPEPPVAKPPPAPVKKPDPPPPTTVSKNKIAQELKDLEAKVGPTIQNEQFGAVIDILEEARKRYDVPDWTQPMAKRIQEVRDVSSALFAPLKVQACNAQARGAADEAKQIRTRVASWGRKDLTDELDHTLAAVVPHEALPPGAIVLAKFPNAERKNYRFAGHVENGALVGVEAFGGRNLGFESGLEIFKIPTEGEVRVVYTTNSTKTVTLTLRAFGPDGKNRPYNHWEKNPVVGRAQLLKVPIRSLKSWGNELINPGAVVDNVYFRQEDVAAVLTVHEFVIYKTKE